MRTKKKKNTLNNVINREEFYITPETKKGIIIVILLTFVILSFLSLFNLAGRFGFYIKDVMLKLFGMGYFVAPFLMLAVTYLVITTRKMTFKIIHYIGITFFILSFYGFLHLTQPLAESLSAAKNGLGGGYLGVILSYPALYALDFWGGAIALIAIFIGSTLLIFNLSLDSLLSGFKILKPLFDNISALINVVKEKIISKKENSNQEEISEEIIQDEVVLENKKEDKEILDENEEGEDKQEKIIFQTKTMSRRKIDIPIDFLDTGGGKPTSGDISKNKEIIKKTLENFNIAVEMGEISIGPTVTQYTLKPAEGVKLAQIISLSNDLALSLAAHPIRIEAPIPGKSLVGIEVPNKTVATVCLRDVMSSREFHDRKSNLMISLGKDVTGKIWFADMGKEPHILVAGSTGSGKSICINSIIISLMYQNSPDDLKFIMIDPKRVELTNYNGTPYLATPVIVDAKLTLKALRWAIVEMERRFEVLAESGSKDIFSYRSKGKLMSTIVIIIDELADLMSAAGPELESLIVRLAQKSRAVGIHLILATQRPSVNVITGVIKANITSRIAFRVASLVDSRTILDSSGAEKLLGRGDMLFVSAEVSKPKRLQGAFVSEQEIKKLTNYLRESYDEVEYDKSITENPKNGAGVDHEQLDEDEELIEDAKEIIVSSGKASTSYLQRRMRIGYNKAARIIDILEERGILGPSEGANKGREILITKDDGDTAEVVDKYKERGY